MISDGKNDEPISTHPYLSTSPLKTKNGWFLFPKWFLPFFQNNLFVIEDAAQAIDSYYIGKDGQKKALGSIGHFGAFSFHETKNIISGEGGMLVINDERFEKRAEIIWEKGTNRSAFFRGEVDKYGWVDGFLFQQEFFWLLQKQY